MNLTPIDIEELPLVLAGLRARIGDDACVCGAFRRIAETVGLVGAGSDLPQHRRAARSLAGRFGIALVDEAPGGGFSWDGRAIRARSEASVLIHEIAHWLVAPPARRLLPDFGLGAGPETGRVAEADAVRCVDDATKEKEELSASLLGILFEAELGLPAILAFIEQNWLEAWDRPAAAELFRGTVRRLSAKGLIDADGRPAPAAVKSARARVRFAAEADTEYTA